MEEKQRKKRTEKRKYVKNTLLPIILIVLVTTAAIVISLSKGKSEEGATLKISTPYIDLLLPSELEDIVVTDEVTYDTVYTRGFYMNYDGEEVPLWRVDFGDSQTGDWSGLLKTDKGNIPVAMTGFTITAEELAALGEEGSRLYGECMQGYNVMLEGIMSDPRFAEKHSVTVGEAAKVKMTYWDVMLPENIKVVENNQDSNYEAIFSGEVLGEMVQLYRVCIGSEQADSLLGYFEVDGAKKPVSVESYTLGEREGWSEDDVTVAYQMMDTINDVIAVIMQSEKFSAEVQ